ncbi:MAG TPA: helix-turn-helix domain-containing protein [Candidatus Saccharimonadales bacterium]
MEHVKPSSKPVVDNSLSDLGHIQNELIKFGLTKKQADIYLLLVLNKELRIQEIVELTRLPRSSVYENVEALFEFGIAEEIIESSFKKIRPYPIGVMRHGIDEKMVQLKKLSSDLDRLEKTITISDFSESVDSASVRYYKNRSGARQLYWNTLNASNVVYVMSDWGRSRYIGMSFYERFVAESSERKIKERVLINLTTDTLNSIKKYNVPGSPQFRTNVQDIRTIDKKRLLIKGDTFIYNNVYSQVYLKNIKIHGFEIESSNFVDTQRSIYETLWSLAQPITLFLD